MSFFEINLFGVYVAPIALLMGMAWLVTAGLRRAAGCLGLSEHVWHPALFTSAMYLIVLSSIVLMMGH